MQVWLSELAETRQKHLDNRGYCIEVHVCICVSTEVKCLGGLGVRIIEVRMIMVTMYRKALIFRGLYISWAIYFANQWKNSILRKAFLRKLYEKVGTGTGALTPAQLGVSTSSNTWNHSAWIRIVLRLRKRGFSLRKTSVSTSSSVYGLTVLPCVLVFQSRHFSFSWRNSFGRYTNRESIVHWERSWSTCTAPFCVLDVRIRKHTDHMAVN